MRIRWLAVALVLMSSVNAPAADEVGWAMLPLKRSAVPSTNSPWVRNPVDAFVLQKLLAAGLAPSPEADRRTLIRRLSVDLTGLLPTPDEIDAFQNDTSANAYAKLVDRLLASPRYGERWARHWLDVVHYADSHGHDEDGPRANAWPYRDYLIRSFNDDKPYGRFVTEQIAGDVLFPDDPAATIATGFLAAGPWDQSGLAGIREDSLDRQIAYYLDRDDIVSSTFSTFAGLTVGCARCHDHKFDPITQDDYYSLQAVFAGINKADRSVETDPVVGRQRAQLQQSLAQARAWKGKPDPALLTAERQAEVAPLIAVSQLLAAMQTNPLAVSLAWRSEALKAEFARVVLEQQLNKKLAKLPPPAQVYCGSNQVKSDGPPMSPRPVHVLKRGEVTKPGDVAVAGSVAAVPGLPGRFKLADPNDEGQRRAALADWLSRADNPLTWRVIANRAWHYHFGKGIVDTPNDFGKMGGAPSHPELLDWLAVEFRDGGGSLKKLHRLLVTSNTYRQSVRHDPASSARDGDNRLLWRMNRTRLDAETVRDSVLLLSGRLDDKMYGPPVQHFISTKGVHVTPDADYDACDVDAPAARRRSIYRYVFRTRPDPLLEALDCPDASQSAPVRSTSVGALQALALWNNKFTLRHAEHLAALADKAKPVEFIIRRLYGRAPTEAERTDLAAYAGRQGLANLCRVLLSSSEFLFID